MIVFVFLKLTGALTSKSYRFNSRSWELNFFHSIDFFDSVGSNIKIEVRGKKILRVLPRQNDDLNQNWITDKIRFSFDSFANQRLGSVYKYDFYKNNLIKINWIFGLNYLRIELLFVLFLRKFGHWSINFLGLLDPFMSFEQIAIFKDFINSLGSSNLLFKSIINYNPNITFRSNFLLKLKLNSLNNYDCILLLNCNPRIESPILNLRLRQKFLLNNIDLFSFGSIINPLYSIINLGVSIKSFILFIEGKHKFNLKFFIFKNPLIIIGLSILKRLDSSFFFKVLNKLNTFLFFSYFVLYEKMSLLAAFDLGFVPGVNSYFYSYNNIKNIYKYNIIFNINNSNLIIKNNNINSFFSYKDFSLKDFYIFNGSFGFDKIINYDLIFPLSILYESTGNYLNIEGRYSIIPLILSNYKDAKWSSFIFNRLFFKKYFYNFNVNYQYPFSVSLNKRINQLCSFSLYNYNYNYSYLINSFFININLNNLSNIYGYLFNNFFLEFEFNFFINDVYSFNSPLMHKASKNALYFNFVK